MNIYDFSANLSGQPKLLSAYKGKVLLIVNTASRCGLTSQYEQLQDLYQQYSAQGLEILDFPCNQFREQAPESNEEYVQVCQMKFGTEFPIFDRIDVNGKNQHPLYAYLKQQQPEDKGDLSFKDFLIRLASLGEKRENSDIKWNFTKFLINRDGEVVARFAPTVLPAELVDDIEALL